MKEKANRMVQLPEDFKGENVVIAIGISEELYVYRMEQWEELMECILAARNVSDKHIKKFIRVYTALAAMAEVSKDNWVEIPDNLWGYISLYDPAKKARLRGKQDDVNKKRLSFVEDYVSYVIVAEDCDD